MDVYHVLNRGVEKRDVVLHDDDRMRFVRSLYIFNDSNVPPNSITQVAKWNFNTNRTPLVYIHAWCLMNNHYHLLVSPAEDDLKNLSLFMKKLNMGYARFFNEKYKRSGYLWQGKYKKSLVSNESYFAYIPYYVHLNALDYTMKEWRKGQIGDLEKSFDQLRAYRWSSYLDYNGVKNFPSVINKSLMSDFLISPENQHQQIKGIINGVEEIHFTQSNALEK